ncbi:MAG TPA: transposase [Ginsengibacter sp.]
MTEKFRGKNRKHSIRLQTWDYAWNAEYFITICTKNREHSFGEIVNEEMRLSEIGKLAFSFWEEIPEHFSFVFLDEFTVMPNHIHGIVLIDKPANDAPFTEIPKVIGRLRFQNQGKDSISSIIGSYKSAVSKNAHLIDPNFNWQSRFHDHIIRDEDSFKRIKNYIRNNPKNWEEDKFYN